MDNGTRKPTRLDQSPKVRKTPGTAGGDQKKEENTNTSKNDNNKNTTDTQNTQGGDDNHDSEISSQIGKAAGTIGKLNKRVWEKPELTN